MGTPTKQGIRVWLPKGKYEDKKSQMMPEGWGNYPELHLAAGETEPLFIRKLIEQANNLKNRRNS